MCQHTLHPQQCVQHISYHAHVSTYRQPVSVVDPPFWDSSRDAWMVSPSVMVLWVNTR